MKLHDIFDRVYLMFVEHLSHLFRRFNYTTALARSCVSREEMKTKLSEKVGLLSDTSEKSLRLSREHILARAKIR